MGREKIRFFLLLTAALLIGAFFLPFLINFASDFIVEKILEGSDTPGETESETETEELTEELAEKSTGKVKITGKSEEEETRGKDEKPESTADKKKTAKEQTDGASASDEQQKAMYTYESEMQEFIDAFHPKITILDTAPEAKKEFLHGEKEPFLTALGEYVYACYGEDVMIAEIEIGECVRDNEDECAYRVVLTDSNGESELFICTYDRRWDFYGIYRTSVEM